MKNLLTALIVLKILGYWDHSWWWIAAPCIALVILTLCQKQCDHCKEYVNFRATKCKHCHSIIKN